jgi:selenium-dependent molybdenum hydroxylase system YqeB family protein
MDKRLNDLVILIRGGGEMATGVAHRLASCHCRVCMTETLNPQAVRREVAFSEAIFDREKDVEGITAKRIESADHISEVWREGKIPILIDPEAKLKDYLNPDVLIDATLAKKNLGTKIMDAPLVIGLGPGFHAGRDVHLVIETNRGHNLGRIIANGEAEPNTGIPGSIAGYTEERVIRAPNDGEFAYPLTTTQLEEIRKTLGDKAEIISEFATPLGEEFNSVKDTEILNLIKRRPCTTEDISRALGLRIDEVVKHLDHLTKTGATRYRTYEHRCYFESISTK